MSQPVYRQLLAVMQKRGGDFSGLDIPEFYAMAEEMFTPQEAEINNAMPRGPFTALDLAQAMGRDPEAVAAILEQMADKGLCQAVKMGDAVFYQSARFMPGILEYQFMPGRITTREKKMARLIHAYKVAHDQHSNPAAASPIPTNRVITVARTIAAGSQVHTYDQVQAYIDQYDPIAVSTCFCRHAALLRDEDIHDMPNDVCMQFGMGAQFTIERLGARQLTKAEAREVLDRSEAAGLIHMSTNMAEGIGFICNCDRWHCVAVTRALSMPKPGLYFSSGFEPRFDAALCQACGTCVERCPADALSTKGADDVPAIDPDRCFGCAVCATGCSEQAITMVNRPGIAPPPKDGQALKAAMRGGRA
jgi:Na+-translocating ferredoxin:NAD+ oxidoreductase subunit B